MRDIGLALERAERRIRGILEHEQRLPHQELVAVAQAALAERAVVEARAVLAAEVARERAVEVADHLEVLAGTVRVVEHQIARLAAPDAQAGGRRGQRERRPGLRATDDDEAGRRVGGPLRIEHLTHEAARERGGLLGGGRRARRDARLEGQREARDVEHVAAAQRLRAACGEPRAIDACAVGRAVVDDDVGAALEPDDRVLLAHRRMREAHVGGGATPDQHAGLLELPGGPCPRLARDRSAHDESNRHLPARHCPPRIPGSRNGPARRVPRAPCRKLAQASRF